MKIYLDIDGTLINKKNQHPAPYLKEFLEYMTSNHDVYWLSTHCQGDTIPTVRYIMQFLPTELARYVQKIKPTIFSSLKTEAIDLNNDFLWFDDYVMQAEKKIVDAANRAHCIVNVDLENSPNLLEEFIESDTMVCKAYIIDLLKKSYMLHIWLKPHFSVGWHRKIDGPNKCIFAIRKY